jgi:hypothetical protein
VFGILAAVYARFVFTELILSLFTLEQLVYAGLFHTIICAVDVKPTSNIFIAELVQSLRTNSAYHHRRLIAFATAADVLCILMPSSSATFSTCHSSDTLLQLRLPSMDSHA